jgi:hypothetical protein
MLYSTVCRGQSWLIPGGNFQRFADQFHMGRAGVIAPSAPSAQRPASPDLVGFGWSKKKKGL